MNPHHKRPIFRLLLFVIPLLFLAPLAPPSAGHTADENSRVLALGNGFTCALDDGGVVCWGYGPVVGTGQGQHQTTPMPMSGLTTGVQAVVAGGRHACALRQTGEVLCWGENNAGQLGDGSTTARVSPVAVTGLHGRVIALAAGGNHSCALLENGTAQCWGLNANGQLGIGSTQPNHTPIPQTVQSLSGITALAGGEAHTCALRHNGSLYCWGYNYFGSVGNGNNEDQYTPVPVIGHNSGITQVVAGYIHTCSLNVGGQIHCWGSLTNSNTPQPLSGFHTPSSQIASNNSNLCAHNQQGLVQCLGANEYGQLGDGTTSSSQQPVTVNGLPSEVTEIGVGYHHACATSGTGETSQVYCWGYDAYGQLGLGGAVQGSSHLNVLHNLDFNQLSMGYTHVCGATSEGAAYCWGRNPRGQLGIGEPVNWDPPLSLPQAVLGLGQGVSQIEAGMDYTCAIVNDGAHCWGVNRYGQLGDGSTSERHTPAPVQGLTTGVTQIATHLGPEYQHTCAVVNGGAYCWGYNYLGQLGNGQSGITTPQTTAVGVTGLASGVSRIAVGGTHTCAVVNGGVQCWGYNYYGQLGTGANGSHTPLPTPQQVVGLTSQATAVVTGHDFSCALVAGGVRCWGRNQLGQLGNGQTSDKASPVAVLGLESGVTALSAHRTTACAVREGQVYCWGTGLGSSPQLLAGLGENNTAVSANQYNNPICAISPSHATCWGNDHNGLLGAGRIFQRATPLAVRGLSQSATMHLMYTEVGVNSLLNLVGTGYPGLWQGEVYLQGQSIGQVQASQAGVWQAVLKTEGLPPGAYRLMTRTATETIQQTILLRTDAPVYPPEGTGTLFTNLAANPTPLAVLVPTTGGALISNPDHTTYQFPAGAFTEAVTVTHQMQRPWSLPTVRSQVAVGTAFDVRATAVASGLPVPLAPNQTFTVTMTYPTNGLAIPESIGLWWWDGSRWSQEGIESSVDVAERRVTAVVSHFSIFALLGDTHHIYLPVAVR